MDFQGGRIQSGKHFLDQAVLACGIPCLKGNDQTFFVFRIQLFLENGRSGDILSSLSNQFLLL